LVFGDIHFSEGAKGRVFIIILFFCLFEKCY